MPHPTINGSSVRLIQAICTKHDKSLVKLVMLGIKEDVKAIAADLIGQKTIKVFGHPDLKRLEPRKKEVSRNTTSKLPKAFYSVCMFNYPVHLNKVVCGTQATMAAQAFRIFNETYGKEIPLLEEFAPVLWKMAMDNNYAVEMMGLGFQPDEQIFQLNLPKLEVFEAEILSRLPQLHRIAEQSIN